MSITLGRLLTGCFWFAILIWNATYTANLASFLVLKGTSLPVNSLDDAYTKGYDVGVIRSSAISQVLNMTKTALHNKIWTGINNKNSFVGNHLEGVERCRDQQYVFIAEEPFLAHHKGRQPCDLVSGKEK